MPNTLVPKLFRFNLIYDNHSAMVSYKTPVYDLNLIEEFKINYTLEIQKKVFLYITMINNKSS